MDVNAIVEVEPDRFVPIEQNGSRTRFELIDRLYNLHAMNGPD